MNSSGESAAREPQPWRVGHKVPINVYDEWGNPVCQCHTPAVAELIVKAVNLSRHYAAREREVQELVKAVEEDTRQIDRTHRLQLALAPFAAKGETDSVASQGEQHDH